MRTLLTALALALASTAQAQLEERLFVRDYDIDTTSYTYCASSVQNRGEGLIETSGSSVTVTAVNATDAPFRSMAAGDLISVIVSGTEQFRYLVPPVTNTSITINAAADWSAGVGFNFTWWDVACGTTLTDGWLPVGTYSTYTINVEYNQGDLTGGLDVRWECKGASPGALPNIVYPDADGLATCDGGTYDAPDCNFATANVGITNRITVDIGQPFSQCRVGMKIGTADGDDVGANVEQITVYLVGRKQT